MQTLLFLAYLHIGEAHVCQVKKFLVWTWDKNDGLKLV